MAQYISDDKKQAIIQAIRDEGKRVVEVAAAHNVSTKSIYTWLRDGVKGDNSALEIAPDLYEAQLNRAVALQVSGDRGRAAEELKRLLARLPEGGANDQTRAAARALLARLSSGFRR